MTIYYWKLNLKEIDNKMPKVRETIRNSFHQAKYVYARRNMAANTKFERQVRGHNHYTMYNSYQKRGGKNWSAFKQSGTKK